MINIDTYQFNEKAVAQIQKNKYGIKWPIVYILNNKKEAYVGESTNAHVRMTQHLSNPSRFELDTINLISSDTFNMSVILDLEAFLIKYMSADGKFKLQNSNNGLQFHNYYQKEEYEKQFGKIWKELKDKGLVDNNISEIENSDLYKYSPYKTLTEDQLEAVRFIIMNLSMCISAKKGGTFLINGSAGTGKTILAIYLIKLISDLNNGKLTPIEQDENEDINFSKNLLNSFKNLKIGLVIPMDNFRTTVRKVFKNVYGLNPSMVISPSEVPNDEYDILIVDEAHRLSRRVSLAFYPSFDEKNKKLGFDENGTQLDWVMKCSKCQILFYDENQSIRPSDVRPDAFSRINNDYFYKQTLKSQLRCLGGNDYIEYINSIFSDNPPKSKIDFKENYDLRLFNDVDKMVNTIKDLNNKYELCRNLAGFAWPWKTKGMTWDKIKKENAYDIDIGDYKYVWNTTNKGFIQSENSINEIGSIHTSQGCDLNYAGIIIGNDLKYDLENERFYIDKKNYYDSLGKSSLKDDDELKEYIIRIYKIMLTRGIKGTFVYACDEGLRKYLSRYFDVR